MPPRKTDKIHHRCGRPWDEHRTLKDFPWTPICDDETLPGENEDKQRLEEEFGKDAPL